MFRNAYQRGMLTIFYSVGSKPLNIWDTYTKNGYISRFLDQDIKSMVLEIGATNVSTTYIICPKGKEVLGISMPFLVMVIKNLKKYFSFEVTILDETGTRRRFRVSNFQSSTQILPLCTVMPIGLSDGWNQIQFNLAEFTRRAYQKQFVEVQKVKINANIRLRRIYFADRLIPEDELPPEYKLYFPVASNSAKSKKLMKDAKVQDNIKNLSSYQTSVEAITEIPKKGSIHSVKKTHSKEGKLSHSSKEKVEAKAECQSKQSVINEIATENDKVNITVKNKNIIEHTIKEISEQHNNDELVFETVDTALQTETEATEAEILGQINENGLTSEETE